MKKDGKEKNTYTEARKKAIDTYRKKGVRASIQLTYKKDRQFILDDGLERYGITMPEYLRLLIENDYNGETFTIPKVEEDKVGGWLFPVFEAEKRAREEGISLKILGSLSGSSVAAIGKICGAAGGIAPMHVIERMLEAVSAQASYALGEIFLRCFEAEGGSREDFLLAANACGFDVNKRFWPREKASFLSDGTGPSYSEDGDEDGPAGGTS